MCEPLLYSTAVSFHSVGIWAQARPRALSASLMGPSLHSGGAADSGLKKRKRKAQLEAKEETKPRPVLPVQEEEAEVLPHRGVVFLDKSAGSALLVHMKTLERRALPAGEWQLDFDDEGFAAVTQLDGEQELFAEDVFQRTLCVSPSDKMLVLEGADGQPKRHWSLSGKLMKHEEVEVKLRAGPTLAEHRFTAFLLTWPRQACRFFWDALIVYKLLLMKSYKGVASKWFYESYKGWHSWLSTWCLSPDQVMQSAQASGQGLDPWLAFLPSCALSSTALVGLLARWAGAAVQQGGLRELACRSAAESLLQGLVTGTRLQRAFQVEIRFTPGWHAPWPLSEKASADLTLEVDELGCVDLAQWGKMHASSLSGTPCRDWMDTLAKAKVFKKGLQLRVPLYLLMVASAGCQLLASFFGQLMWQLGQALEKAAFTALKTGSQHQHAIAAAYTNLHALMKRPASLNSYLMKYVMSSISATAGWRSCSMAVDKANVGGMSLQSGAFVLPDNTALVAVPQAFRGIRNKAPQVGSGGPGIRGKVLLIIDIFWWVVYMVCLCFFVKTVYTTPLGQQKKSSVGAG